MIVKNNDKNYANNLFNMIFMQVKRLSMVCIFLTKELPLFWDRLKEEPYTTKVSSQSVLNL